MIYTVTEEGGTKGLEQLAGSSSTGTPLGTWASFENDYAPNIEWLQGGTTFNPNTYPALAMYLGGNTVPERFDHSKPSAWETITLPTTSATAITMQYDGELIAQFRTSGDIHIYINGTDIKWSLSSGAMIGTCTIPFKKGDVIYCTSTYTISSYVKYYKHPLFIKATPTSADSDYEGTLNAIREFYVRNNTYSTEERLTGGTWIDGKPIYRRVLVLSSSMLLDTSWRNVIADWGVDFIVKSFCYGSPTSTYGFSTVIIMRKDNNNIQARVESRSLNADKFVVEYTKTTD